MTYLDERADLAGRVAATFADYHVLAQRDASNVARLTAALEAGTRGYRDPAIRDRIVAAGRWRDVPFADESTDRLLDPRTLSIVLDDMLPAERTVAIDSCQSSMSMSGGGVGGIAIESGPIRTPATSPT